jgi:hypothetical protein
MSLHVQAPCGLSLGVVALLLKGKRRFPLPIRRASRLPHAVGGGHRQRQAESQLYFASHVYSFSILFERARL